MLHLAAALPTLSQQCLTFYPAWQCTLSLFPPIAAIIPVPSATCECLCWREPLSLQAWLCRGQMRGRASMTKAHSSSQAQHGRRRDRRAFPLCWGLHRPRSGYSSQRGKSASPSPSGNRALSALLRSPHSPGNISSHLPQGLCPAHRCSSTEILMENQRPGSTVTILMQIRSLTSSFALATVINNVFLLLIHSRWHRWLEPSLRRGEF